MLYFKSESTKIPTVHFIQSLRSGYWSSFPRWLQGFTRGSRLRNFFFGISLREKGRERHEGFSFRDTMQSLMASLITCGGQIQGLNPKCHIISVHVVSWMRESWNPFSYVSKVQAVLSNVSYCKRRSLGPLVSSLSSNYVVIFSYRTKHSQ